MTNKTKWHRAMDELADAGIGAWAANPPLTRVFRALNLSVRPPHYASFRSNLLSLGAYFAVIWGALMWFMLWRHQTMPFFIVIAASLLGGLLFGAMMAAYYQRKRTKLQLSAWEQL